MNFYVKMFVMHHLIYKSKHGVCVCVFSYKQGRAWHGRAGQGRAARADTRPLDLLAIYKILEENRGTYI
jgi:ribosomal protein L15E